MGHPAKRYATYEDVLAAPEGVVAEILDGVLYTHPRPAARHARAASRLGAELDGPFDRGRGGPGGWIILREPELHLGGDVLAADIAAWRHERMPQFPYDATYFETAPNFVCEVLSPSTARTDRRDKLPIYARAGVDHAWLIDPVERSLEVFTRHEHRPKTWVLVAVYGDEAPIRAVPFDAIALDLASLWPA